MKKLKSKVFYTILGILTLSLLSFIVIFNIQNYEEQKDLILRNLNMNNLGKHDDMPPMDDKKNPIDKNIRFMDIDLYTVLLNSNNEIIEINNHSNDETSFDIKNIVNEIIKGNKKEYIGNLYFDNYSYSYNKGNSIVIIDNSNSKEILLNSLRNSLIIFIILEIIIIYISKLISNWIVKPIIETFNKQKDFIADASHELKTPLSVIMASSEALRENPKEMKWLDNIQNESLRMNNLIIDLLDLARTENDNNIVLSDGNLSHAIELSVLTFEGRAYEKNIKLEYNIEPNIMIKMNENSIRQVIEILLDNAIKHSNEKGKVIVNLKKNNNIILTVSNYGEEIPKGEEEKIFERFYRVDKSRNRNENRYGLGLAIAKNIIELHGGKITATSINNMTTFKIVLKK